jgi:DNA-binding FadR family transcriptional regulator
MWNWPLSSCSIAVASRRGNIAPAGGGFRARRIFDIGAGARRRAPTDLPGAHAGNKLLNSQQISAADAALTELRSLLDAHTDRPEWRLPGERDLALELRLGRRAIRSALGVLEAEQRVWRRQGKGTFAGQRPAVSDHVVASMAERTSPLEVMEARLEIEPGLARLAAAKASPDIVTKLNLILRRLVASDTADAMERFDGAFHRLIADTAGNRLLMMTFDVIDRIRLSPTWREPRALARSVDKLRVTNEQHASIVDAIDRHDGAEAESAMRRHLLTLHTNLQQSLFGRSG